MLFFPMQHREDMVSGHYYALLFNPTDYSYMEAGSELCLDRIRNMSIYKNSLLPRGKIPLPHIFLGKKKII